MIPFSVHMHYLYSFHTFTVLARLTGFSNLMKTAPELTMAALLAHNDIIVDCQRKNFGHLILREGGELPQQRIQLRKHERVTLDYDDSGGGW